jgi:hypothetical protein
MGESGSGKTTSCRNLDPSTTFYIDCDLKGLSWKGWRKQYNVENKNYYKGNFPTMVMKYLDNINKNAKHIKTVVIDTLNGIMIGEEMRSRSNKNYDKWTDLAGYVYDIVEYALTVRDDLNVVFIAHTQTETNDLGYTFTRIKTSGRKLDKISLESKFTTVLLSKKIDDSYVFETQSNNSTAKSPMGAFETLMIPNDIVTVLEALDEF